MTTFVLVPGAWHGAWCWEFVTPLLEKSGHIAVTPELLGTGRDRARVAEGDIAVWAEQVSDMIRPEPDPVVLVGHSRGGLVISEVAERTPDSVALSVYVSGFLLEPGDTILAASTRASRDYPLPTISPTRDGAVELPREALPLLFYNTTDPELAERAVSFIAPEPAVTLTSVVQVTQERFGSVPRAYIECRQDRIVPLALQRAMNSALPCEPVVTLDCDHSPFYSQPEALAAALLSLAQERSVTAL